MKKLNLGRLNMRKLGLSFILRHKKKRKEKKIKTEEGQKTNM